MWLCGDQRTWYKTKTVANVITDTDTGDESKLWIVSEYYLFGTYIDNN